MQHQTPGTGAWRTLGRFGGLPIAARPEMTDGQLQVQVGFPDLRHSEATYTVDDLTGDKIGGTMLLRLATALEKAPDHQSLDRQRLPELETEITLLTQQQEAADFTDRIDHARQRANLLDDVVATIAERDTIPELNDGDLDPEKYPTAEVRQQMIARRVTERQPLQAKVDQAIQNLNDFDRDHPAPDSAPPDSSTVDPSSDVTEATPQPPVPAGRAAEDTRPDWMTPARHAQLVKVITDYAPRYTAANTNGVLNSPARYVAEVHAPGGATREEWNWIADYIRQHPQVREGKPLTDDELAARDRAASTALSQHAMQALQAGDPTTTFAIIDQAEPLYGHLEPWDQYRTAIQEHIARQQPTAPADPQPTPAPRSAAADNAAIAAQAFRPVSPSPASPPSAAATAAPATVRGAHPTRPEHDNAR
ncbi:hypothetical protein [Micromonospora sp. NPDC023633]|uniref:hypothetical protein n=1 Tax=Micromonospora sp. NPDC023633 TaxID=3154320 RepID=UPI0033C97752